MMMVDEKDESMVQLCTKGKVESLKKRENKTRAKSISQEVEKSVAVMHTEVTYHWPITALSVTVQTQCPFYSVYY